MGINDYLKERPGYLKKGPNALYDIMKRQGFDDIELEELEVALREERERRKLMDTPNVETKVVKESPVDFDKYTPVKIWGKEGNWNISYELKSEEEENKIKELIDELKTYVDSRPKPVIEETKGNGKKGFAVITDLHIGAKVQHLVSKTPEYTIKTVIDYLAEVAKQINEEEYSEVSIGILGDLIESFTGTNHSATWKELDTFGYGSEVLIIAYEILAAFLSSINNLKEVFIVGGNHDRVTQKNDEDPNNSVAHIISYFLNKKIDCPVIYDNMIITAVIDDVDYILTHGHLPMIRKNPEYLILNYGKNRDNFTMLLSGHLHNRGKKDQTNTSMVIADAAKYRAMCCPSIFTGNFYSESSGFSSSPGFMLFESKNGKPRVIDVTL